MIVVATLLYLAASALVLGDHLANESDHASAGQLVGAGVAAALLIVGALLIGSPDADAARGRGPESVAGRRRSPSSSAWARSSLPPSPLGTDALLLVYAAAAVAIWWLSGRPGWGRPHAAAVAVGALSAFALVAFRTDPIGHVTDAEKLGHNVGLLVLVTARRRPRGTPGRESQPRVSVAV